MTKKYRKPHVYLAARYSRRLEMVGVTRDLEREGYVVTSRWIGGKHQATEIETVESAVKSIPSEEGRKFAREDVVDVLEADLLIAFTEEPRSSNSRGGRHVEFGMAWALRKPILVVGPRENVFHTLKNVRHHPRWHDSKVFDLLRAMVNESRERHGV